MTTSPGEVVVRDQARHWGEEDTPFPLTVAPKGALSVIEGAIVLEESPPPLQARWFHGLVPPGQGFKDSKLRGFSSPTPNRTGEKREGQKCLTANCYFAR